jgi:D-arabinose 1-dehydrogenase-like Zn-dependent alcohol dehydrogenase
MKMKAVQVAKPGGAFEIVEREVPQPGPRQVRVKVQACGVCHSDALVKEGHWPGISYPRIPGHEVVGVLDAVGKDVPAEWTPGTRVGIGWYGGHCGHCESCRRGQFIVCANGLVTAIHFDGGYAEYMVAPFDAVARVPDGMGAVDGGPLMCAGITTFNSLRNTDARPGDMVAVLGVGGLGHLGVQYAAKMGFRTVAIARGKDKAGFVKELGAHAYIDSQVENVAEALQKLGGAKVVIATATNAKAMADTIPGLAVDGTLVVLGAPAEPLSTSVFPLIAGRRSIRGWPSGTSIDSEDTLNFSALHGVKPMVETYPLERAAEAYDRMMSGNARFRVVLTVGQ